jgi:glycosyltransferase involved in cell wall biosynthesis
LSSFHRNTYTIGFYCSSIARGGLEMNLVRYALWMSQQGWKVKIFCVEGSPIFNMAAEYQLTVIIIRRNRKYLNIASAIRLAKLFRHHQVELCWFRDTRDFQILGTAKKLSGNSFKLVYQQAMQFGVSKRDMFHTLRFQPVDAWVSTLQFLAEQVRKQTRFPHQKIHVVPLGADSSGLRLAENLKHEVRKQLNLPQDKFIVGIIGRIDPLKGQHTAIESIALLHAKGIEAHLLVMGESTLHEGNTYHEQIKNLVAKSRLSEYVHFRPYTSEVYRFYHAIDVFTLCSKGETFGTVTVEAMACGLPVIATNSSGSPEILQHGECGLLFTPGDSNMLAAAIARIYSDQALAQKLSQAARSRFLSEYSKEVSTDRMDKLVRQILSQ